MELEAKWQTIQELKAEENYEEARRLLEELIVNDFKNYRLFEELTDVYLSMGKISAAKKSLEQVFRFKKDSPNAYFFRGFIACVERKFVAAIEDLEYADYYLPHRAEILRHLGWAYFQHGEKKKGILCLERAATIQPINILVWLDLGMCYLKQRKTSEAVRCFERAVELDPADIRAQEYRRLAYVLQCNK